MNKTIQFIKANMPFMPLQVLNVTSAKELKEIKKDIERITKARTLGKKQNKNKGTAQNLPLLPPHSTRTETACSEGSYYSRLPTKILQKNGGQISSLAPPKRFVKARKEEGR